LNVIDKLSRIIERLFFNVNLQVAKIYDNLLDPLYFHRLNSDVVLLITFANNVMNLLEFIKSTQIGRQLEKKVNLFLNFLQTNNGLNEEQIETIRVLLSSSVTKYASVVFQNVRKLLFLFLFLLILIIYF